MFKIYGGDTKFTQWTKNQKLIMSRLPLGAEVLFYNDPKEDEPLVTEVYEYTDENGISFHVCDVPNIFLTDTKRIKVRIPSKVVGLYGIVHSYVGQLERYFEVEPAEKPADYVYEETTTEGCEGQIQADLSQTDSAQVDYVKGVIRQESLPEGYPYKEMATILDGTFEFSDHNGIYMYGITDENFAIAGGKSYTVIWDGVTYQCVATNYRDMLVLGNLAIAGVPDSDTGEPFLFADGMIAANNTAATHTITVRGEVAYPIASEFLPDEYVTETELMSKGYITETELTSKGYLTSYTETDPTVPAWAKSKTKPSYDFSELTVTDPEAAKTALSIENGMILKNLQAAMPSSASWDSVTYGNGKFVAVDDSNYSTKAAYSEDGITWTATTMPGNARWNFVTYGNGKFVAVADNSTTAAYSEDGIAWTKTTLPISKPWNSVAYGNGKFVALAGLSGTAAYSEDGITWTATDTIPTAGWKSVTYGNGKFVAIASVSTTAAYSEDGITWTETTMPSTSQWISVTYGNGKFVAVAYNNSTIAAYSEDGITWSSSTMPSTARWWPITYGNGKFVAIADNSDIAAYSEDGINWTVSTLPISRYWRSVTYGNGKFVALASSSADTAFSYDGINWQTELKIISQNESDITESVRSVINKSIYETIVGVPACTTADNGKVLKVVDGVPTWVEAQ